MEENKIKHYSHRKSGLTFGIILVLLGMLFLAFNFGVLDGGWKRVVFSWQMLLIVTGLISMFHRHIFNGLVFISVGGFFVMPRLAATCPDTFYWVEQDFTRTYWPVLLIVAGILILLHIVFRPKWHTTNYYTNYSEHKHEKEYHKGIHINHSGFERNSVFGNVEEIILEPEFNGGEFNAIFGGITLDLRKTAITEGETKIELNAVFGGITIHIPSDWHVELHLDSVFGTFQDNRILSENIDHSRKLIIIGNCVFGGGEILN